MRTDQVKTSGTSNWQGCGAVVRLFVPSDNCDYGRLGARSLATLLGGSKGRSQDKVDDDVSLVRSLRTAALELPDDSVAHILQEAQTWLVNVGSGWHR